MILSDDGRWQFYLPSDLGDEDSDTRAGMAADAPGALARGACRWKKSDYVNEWPWQLLTERSNDVTDTWWLMRAKDEPTPEKQATILDMLRLIWSLP
jgi:hypothetical protein